jgi:hypothetical protein
MQVLMLSPYRKDLCSNGYDDEELAVCVVDDEGKFFLIKNKTLKFFSIDF